MRLSRLTTILATICSFGFTHSAFAAAYQLYELGTPVIGTAGVGQASLANDASTAYFNPAGMTQLPDAQFLLGSQLVLPYNNFSKSSATTIAGDNGGEAGTLTPGLNMYYVYSVSPALKLGISLTSPYAGALNYTDGWAGRFIVQDVEFYTLNLNPSIAYRFNQYFSAGAGVAVEYANLEETIALPLTRLVDGQANIKVDNLAAGGNVGFLFNPTESTQVGLAYRSRITHNYHGNVTFLRIGDTPNVTTQMIMPQNIILSLTQNITNQFTLLGEAGWANWAAMKSTPITVVGLTGHIPLDWHNTYRVGVAGQYFYTPAFMLQAGISYDSSPTSASHRLPDLPMDKQIRAGAGVLYNFTKSAKIGLSYEYVNFGSANINNLSLVGRLRGSYWRNFGNILQVSINVDC